MEENKKITDRDVWEQEKKQIEENIIRLKANLSISEAVLIRVEEELSKLPPKEDNNANGNSN